MEGKEDQCSQPPYSDRHVPVLGEPTGHASQVHREDMQVLVKTLSKVLPFPTGKIHAHSFVLGLELGVHSTDTSVKISEHHRFKLDTHTSPFLTEVYVITDMNAHTRKVSWLTNSNSLRIHVRQEVEIS